MIKKIIILLIFKLSLFSFSQTTNNYIKIENIETEKYFQIMDTLSFDEASKFRWNKTTEKNREISRKTILKQKKMVKADSLFLTNIYYLGLKDSVYLKPLNVYFSEKKSEFKYEYQSLFENDSIFKKKLGHTNRYIGYRKFVLYFVKKKRYALINIDTNYSEIFINVRNIKKGEEILEEEQIEKERKNNSNKEIYSNNEKIEVDLSPVEKIMIDHNIPDLE